MRNLFISVYYLSIHFSHKHTTTAVKWDCSTHADLPKNKLTLQFITVKEFYSRFDFVQKYSFEFDVMMRAVRKVTVF